MKRTILCLAAAVSLLLCGTAFADVSEDLADLPVGLSQATAAIDGDDIYVVSGFDATAGWTDAVYRYSIEGDVWSTDASGGGALATIPTARTEACNTGMIEGYDQFCVIGGAWGTGMSWGGPSDAVECYDPAANTWTALDSLPIALTGVYCAEMDGVIYVTGGYTGSVYNTQLWWLDTADLGSGWQTAPEVRPINSFNGRAAMTQDPALDEEGEWRFSQFMGTSASSTHYGLDTGLFSTAADYTDRVYSCVVPDGPFNTLFLGGGDFGTVTPYPTSNEIVSYDSNSDTWTVAEETIPYTQAAMACVQDEEGNVYMFGGYSTDLKEKDLKLGLRINIPFERTVAVSRTFYSGQYMYLYNTLGSWTHLAITFFILSIGMSVDADVEEGGNGTARVEIPEAEDFDPTRMITFDWQIGRQSAFDFDIQIPDDDVVDEGKIFFDGFDLGLYIQWNINLDTPYGSPGMFGGWELDGEDDEFIGTLRTKLTFKNSKAKEEEDYALELEDTSAAADGRFFMPVFPFSGSDATISWEMAVEEGGGLSFALYDEVGDSPNEALFVDMLDGQLSMSDGEGKAVTDCQLSLSAEQWYLFTLEMDLDAGTAALSVDGTETACNNVAIPFGEDAPVQGLGFVLSDQAEGVTWLDNITVEAEPQAIVDDDDDTGDDDTGDDDTDDDDDDDEGDDDDDDDDDDGCCGC